MLISNDTFENEVRGVMLSGGLMLFAKTSFDGSTYTLEQPHTIAPAQGGAVLQPAFMSRDPKSMKSKIDKSHVVLTYQVAGEIEEAYCVRTGTVMATKASIITR